LPGRKADRRRRAKDGGGAAAAPPPSPVELGIRYIARRLRFESEVRTHLRGKGVHGAELEEAVGRLQELGMLSDFETCRAWIRDKIRFSPRSRMALRVQLKRKGAGEAAIDAALEEAFPAGGEVELAVDVLKRSVRAVRSLPEPVRRRRLWSALARRGFDREVTREAVARVLGDTEESEP
jgi:regulatory protein